MKSYKTIIRTTPFILAITWALISTSLVVAVTYWHDTQTITQSFGEGGQALFKNIALPVAFLQTPDQHLETDALNVTTYVDTATFSISQTTSQRSNLGNTYNILTLNVIDANTQTVALTIDLLLDLQGGIALPIAGTYNFDYTIDYEAKVSSGTIQIDVSLDLIS
jgi:hypothetical protein